MVVTIGQLYDPNSTVNLNPTLGFIWFTRCTVHQAEPSPSAKELAHALCDKLVVPWRTESRKGLGFGVWGFGV